MRATHARFVALALVVALAPAAAAQSDPWQTATEVIVRPLQDPVAPGATAQAGVEVRYHYPLYGGVATEATTIRLEVTALPDWAQAAPEPAEVTVQPTLTPVNAAQRTATAHANLTIEVAGDAPMDKMGAVRLRAVAEENPPLSASTGETMVAVQTGSLDQAVNGTGGGAGAEDAGAGAASEGGAEAPLPPTFALLALAAVALSRTRRRR